jgi:hypothetical protein
VNGSSETNSSSTRFRRIKVGSQARMNPVTVLWAAQAPPMNAKLTT